jgi:hypothetical protein
MRSLLENGESTLYDLFEKTKPHQKHFVAKSEQEKKELQQLQATYLKEAK